MVLGEFSKFLLFGIFGLVLFGFSRNFKCSINIIN